MSLEPVHAFEHAPTGTLARAHHDSRHVQILREGREVARYAATPWAPATSAGGRLGWWDRDGALRWVDLDAAVFPEEPETGPGDLRVLRDRTSGLAFSDPRHPDAATRPFTGLALIGLDGALIEPWGLPSPELGREILLGEPRTWAPRDEPIWQQLPTFVFAPDGERWALFTSERVVIGRKDRTTGVAFWRVKRFYAPIASFDVDSERLWISGGPGGVVGLDDLAEPVARWEGEIGGERSEALSAPLRVGGELWVVVRVPGSARTAVARLDGETGAFLGYHAAFGELRDPDGRAALCALADGSVAWCPRTLPIRILPGPGVDRASNLDAGVLGRAPYTLFPEPEEPWYIPAIGRTGEVERHRLLTEPGARHSFARYLLDQRVSGHEIGDLLCLDPASFQPFADRLLALDDPALRAWGETSSQAGYAAFGASDAAVDGLVARLPRTEVLSKLDRLRVRMLAAVLSPHALAHAGVLGRASTAIHEVLAKELIEVPVTGSAVPRFALERREVVLLEHGEAAPGVESGRPAAEWCSPARGRQCALPLVELLTVPADRLYGPLRRPFTFFVSGCVGCDEAETGAYPFHFTERGIALEGTEELDCNGEGFVSQGAAQVGLIPCALWVAGRSHGHIGGRPSWWEHPEVPLCPVCHRLQFFVGQVEGTLRGDAAEVGLWGFVCEDCDRGVVLTQRV